MREAACGVTIWLMLGLVGWCLAMININAGYPEGEWKLEWDLLWAAVAGPINILAGISLRGSGWRR